MCRISGVAVIPVVGAWIRLDVVSTQPRGTFVNISSPPRIAQGEHVCSRRMQRRLHRRASCPETPHLSIRVKQDCSSRRLAEIRCVSSLRRRQRQKRRPMPFTRN
ncbi:hypothetical protein IEO21_06644 [Rhodonia placenta]|uniref:Uncharacterized protein n=1 Tax=Rhodonia placenta TaxID=104341 RepID=A0A8H7U0J5_9APHY|nr:hypothetical protein IEO21_06644 [Postia placenta]